MSAKRDDQGRLLCKRPGCDRLRVSDRECAEHHAMTHATFLDNVSRTGGRPGRQPGWCVRCGSSREAHR